MKRSAAVLTCCALALASSITATTAVATATTTQLCVISELQALMATPYTMACMSESGLDFSKLTGAPTAAQTQSFCKSSACTSLVKAVLAQNPPDCTIPLVNVKFRSELFNPLASACGIAAGGSSASSPSPSSTTPAATAGKNGTSAPSNSTSAPSNKNQTKSTNNLDSNLDTDAGVPKDNLDSSPTPATPAPTSGAAGASLAASVSAATLGIVAALALVL